MDAFFPVFLRSSKVRCLMIGAGRVAARKTKALISNGIKPVIIAPEACEEMAGLIREHNLKWIDRVFMANDTSNYNMVIAATSSMIVNHLIKAQIGENVLFDDISNMNNSNFIIPAVIERGGVKIAISTSGQAPFLAKEICLYLDKILPCFTKEDLQQIALKRKEIISFSGDELLKKARLENDLKPMIHKFFKKD